MPGTCWTDSQPSLNSEPQVPLKEMNGIFEGDTEVVLWCTHTMYTHPHMLTHMCMHTPQKYTPTHAYTQTHNFQLTPVQEQALQGYMVTASPWKDFTNQEKSRESAPRVLLLAGSLD